MSTKINLSYDNHDYVLEYSRAAVRQMENNGFILEQLGEKPVTMLPLLVQGAFFKNHRTVNRQKIDEIFAHVTNKMGDEGDGFVHALLEMYAETINTLTGDEAVDEGNKAVWTVTKG